MTREEIMKNRILDKDTIGKVRKEYEFENTFLSETWEEIEENEQLRYISDEKIQRMPPEQIMNYLLNYAESFTNDDIDIDSVFNMFSAATGRPKEELQEAIFGTGDFDAKKFYQPTAIQKDYISFILKTARQLLVEGKEFNNYDKWPDDKKEKLNEIVEQIPEYSDKEFFGECGEYLQYYLKNGLPVWLKSRLDLI